MILMFLCSFMLHFIEPNEETNNKHRASNADIAKYLQMVINEVNGLKERVWRQEVAVNEKLRRVDEHIENLEVDFKDSKNTSEIWFHYFEKQI